MTKEELKQEAEESFEQYKVTDEDYVVSPYSDDMGEKMLMFNYEYEAEETYLRLYTQGYLAGAEPREKYIAELKAQIEKMKEVILDLLWFEDNLDPYMYECDDAQNGELLKPFTNAREFLKDCICKKCKGEGIVRVGYNGWVKNPCPICKGRGYVIRSN